MALFTSMQYESWLLCSKGNWRNMAFCSMCGLWSISSWPLDFHPLNLQNVWIARHFLEQNHNQLSKLLLRRESRLGNKIVAKNCHHFCKKGNFFFYASKINKFWFKIKTDQQKHHWYVTLLSSILVGIFIVNFSGCFSVQLLPSHLWLPTPAMRSRWKGWRTLISMTSWWFHPASQISNPYRFQIWTKISPLFEVNMFRCFDTWIMGRIELSFLWNPQGWCGERWSFIPFHPYLVIRKPDGYPLTDVCKVSEWKLQAVAGSRARKGDFGTDQGVDDFMVEIEIVRAWHQNRNLEVGPGKLNDSKLSFLLKRPCLGSLSVFDGTMFQPCPTPWQASSLAILWPATPFQVTT